MRSLVGFLIWWWIAGPFVPLVVEATIYYADNTLPGGCVNGSTTYSPTANSGAGGCGTGTAKIFSTINNSLSSLTAPGDTLLVRAGTYAEAIIYTAFPVSGTSSPTGRITIAAYPGDARPLIRPTSGCRGILMGNKHWITFDGINVDTSQLLGVCSLTEGATGVAVDFPVEMTGLTLRNMDIGFSGGSNFFILDQALFENLVVHHTGAGAFAGGYSCENGANGLYLEARNSTFRDLEVYYSWTGGLRIYSNAGLRQSNNNVVDRVSVHHIGTFDGTTYPLCNGQPNGNGFIIGDQNNTVQNSLAYANSARGIWMYTSPAGPTSGNKLYNNTSTGNNWGLVFANPAHEAITTSTNNLIVSNTTYQTASGTAPASNRITGSITDCTISSTDLHLKVGTNPCVNTGTTIASVTTDKDGIARPQGSAYDIGAYERRGTTYYVATTGSDSSPTPTDRNTPWRNIEKCVDTTSPLIGGDTCLVLVGTYNPVSANGIHVYVRKGGTTGNALVLKSEVLHGATVIVPNLVLEGAGPGAENNLGFYVPVSNVVIEGFRIDGTGVTNQASGGGTAGVYIGANNVSVVNNDIVGVGRNICSNSLFGNTGIFSTNASGLLFHNNIIRSVGRRRNGELGCSTDKINHDHGIYVSGGSFNAWRNLIYDTNRGYAFHLFGGTITSANIWNNTIDADALNVTNTSPFSAILIGSTANNLSLRNNIAVDVHVQGAMYEAFNLTCSNITYDYELTDDNDADLWHGTKPTCATPGGNNLISSNPLFVNPASRNYTLAPGSPAIDSGLNVGLSYSGSSPDRGYHESAPGLDSTPPSPPTGIVVR